MNHNTIAYVVYICITLYIIVYVGKKFHGNGRIFIYKIYKGDAETCDRINNILLVAYYLFNVGYAFLQLTIWEKVATVPQFISSLSQQIGLLVLILAITHYFNMFLIYIASKKQVHKSKI